MFDAFTHNIQGTYFVMIDDCLKSLNICISTWVYLPIWVSQRFLLPVKQGACGTQFWAPLFREIFPYLSETARENKPCQSPSLAG